MAALINHQQWKERNAMNNNNDDDAGGTPPPKFQLMRKDPQHWEVWVSDRVASYDDRDQAERMIDLLKNTPH